MAKPRSLAFFSRLGPQLYAKSNMSAALKGGALPLG
jgi:hypothetical protein